MNITQCLTQLFITQLFVLCLFSLPPKAFSSPQQDTLPDGTPFRVDAQGNEIVDYIAELEHAVRYLKERVSSLELDSENKNLIIKRLKAKRSCLSNGLKKPSISERDLIRDSHPTEKAAPKERSVCPFTKAQYTDLQNRVLELEESLSRSRKETKALYAKISALQSHMLNFNRGLSTFAYPEPVFTLTLAFNPVKSLLRQRQVSNLEALLKEEQKQKEAEKKKILARANAINRQATHPQILSSSTSQGRKGRFKFKSYGDVYILTSRIIKEINSASALLKKRNSEYRRYASTRRAISFKLSPAVSSRGRTLGELKRSLKYAKTVRAALYINREVQQIKRKIAEDLALIKRMSRLR